MLVEEDREYWRYSEPLAVAVDMILGLIAYW